MSSRNRSPLPISLCPLWLAGLLVSGCASLTSQQIGITDVEVPRGDVVGLPDQIYPNQTPPMHAPPAELAKVSLPDYRIEPPDILLLQGVSMIPKTPYELQPLDQVQILVLGTTPEQPIAGVYQIAPTGLVNLGPGYGSVRIAGLDLEEAEVEIRTALQRTLTQPEVAVSLVQINAQQLLQGEHLVGPDGTLNLGVYGRVYVAGMSTDEARAAVEERLAQYFDEPQVSVDVFVYNSKFFYVISEGGGIGENVARIPVTGNETVLDAVATVGGLDSTASSRIWISRPAPSGIGCDQVLPVDWKAITRGASVATNYQILPGDRLFIAQDRLVATNSLVAKLLNPFERILGFSLLGVQTVQTSQRFPEGRLF